MNEKIIPLGSKTKFGIVSMIGNLTGERYYWSIDKHKSVNMMPANVVENLDNKKEIK